MKKRPSRGAFGDLTDKRALISDVALALAEKLPELVDEGFQRRGDPEGGPWARRKDDLPHPLLELTGKMRGGIKAQVQGSSVLLTTDVPYLKYHQKGTPRMVARRLAPVSKLPTRWKTVLDAAALAALEKLRNGRS